MLLELDDTTIVGANRFESSVQDKGMRTSAVSGGITEDIDSGVSSTSKGNMVKDFNHTSKTTNKNVDPCKKKKKKGTKCP